MMSSGVDRNAFRSICQQLMRSIESDPVAATAGPNGRRTGRPSGSPPNREAILASARQQFIEHGYDGATIRGIAAGAGVAAAVVPPPLRSQEWRTSTTPPAGGAGRAAAEAAPAE